MKDLLLLLAHLLTTLAKLLGTGGTKAIVPGNLLYETAAPDRKSVSAACTQSDYDRPNAARFLVAISEFTRHSASN